MIRPGVANVCVSDFKDEESTVEENNDFQKNQHCCTLLGHDVGRFLKGLQMFSEVVLESTRDMVGGC